MVNETHRSKGPKKYKVREQDIDAILEIAEKASVVVDAFYDKLVSSAVKLERYRQPALLLTHNEIVLGEGEDLFDPDPAPGFRQLIKLDAERYSTAVSVAGVLASNHAYDLLAQLAVTARVQNGDDANDECHRRHVDALSQLAALFGAEAMMEL